MTKNVFRPEAENLALIGPPRHNEMRSIVSPAFNPRIVAQIREQVRQICRDMLDSIQIGHTVNWSRQVAEPLPLMVIAILLGMPLSELDTLKYYSDEVIKMGADLSQGAVGETVAGLAPMYEYFAELLAERDRNPKEDLLTTLQQAYRADLIGAETVHMLLAGVLAAGNETTRNTINGAIILLSEHPEQMKLLASKPELAKNATEEFLRCVSPVRGFGRTVAEETVVRGQKLSVGQHVFNFFMSGNRDEDVFDDPEVFDLVRQRKMPNLAFGIGQHFCIGAALARMEIAVLFEELIGRFSEVALDGTPHRDGLQFTMWEDVRTVFH